MPLPLLLHLPLLPAKPCSADRRGCTCCATLQVQRSAQWEAYVQRVFGVLDVEGTGKITTAGEKTQQQNT